MCFCDVSLIKIGALYSKTGGKDHAGREAGRDAGPEGLCWEGRWESREKGAGTSDGREVISWEEWW